MTTTERPPQPVQGHDLDGHDGHAGGPPTTEVIEAAEADVVDFDALHAALGDLPPPAASSTPLVGSPTVGESQGRSSATYSSARPHTIPPTRAPAPEVLNAPAVIVADVVQDTVPSGAPQMTVPMGAPGVVVSSPYGPPPAPMRPPSQSSPQHPPFNTPQPFAAQATPMGPLADNPNVTVHMPNRPRPRPRTPTMVVRTRGPSKQQKLLVFMAMLLVFVGGGIAALIYLRPGGLSLPGTKSTPVATPPALTTPAMTTPTWGSAPTATSPFVVSTTPIPTTAPSALPSASASTRKVPRPR